MFHVSEKDQSSAKYMERRARSVVTMNRRRRPRALAFLSVCFSLTAPTGSSFQLKPSLGRLSRHLGSHRLGGDRWTPPSFGLTRQSQTLLHMSNAPAFPQKASVSVSIDESLLPDNLFTKPKAVGDSSQLVAKISKFLGTLFASNFVRIAAVTFIFALVVSILAKRAGPVAKFLGGRMERLRERFRPAPVGVPMVFDEQENEGWGVCSLFSKRRLGKSSFVQYDFELPEPEHTLPLDLGQTIQMCCLDSDNNVAKGEFFVFNPTAKPKPGTFSVLAPNRSPSAIEYEVGEDTANLVRVLKQDVKVGDEIALKPGERRLSYKGQYLPVTDMVYIACGVGIVPVLDQIRTVLPNGSSSVNSVTVVWVNESTKDFDVLSELLEKEYFKYNTKLAVSCVVDDLRINSFNDNDEINSSVPDFRQGTMAVLSGPREIMNNAREFLQNLGYPTDTICVL